MAGVDAAVWIALAGTALSAGAATHGALQQQAAQKRSLRTQEAAQNNAETVALRQRREAAQAAAAAARRQPDFSELMAGEEALSRVTSNRGTVTPPTPPRPATLGGY